MFSPRGDVTRRWKGYDPSSYAISAFEAGRLIGVADSVRSSDPAEVADVAIAAAQRIICGGGNRNASPPGRAARGASQRRPGTPFMYEGYAVTLTQGR